MEKTIIRSERLGIEVCRIKHDSGLTMLLCPMEGQRAYILQGQAASLFQVYGCVFRYLYNLC